MSKWRNMFQSSWGLQMHMHSRIQGNKLHNWLRYEKLYLAVQVRSTFVICYIRNYFHKYARNKFWLNQRVNTICKDGKFCEEGKKINNFMKEDKRYIYDTLRMSHGNINRGCGHQQTPYFALRMTVKLA